MSQPFFGGRGRAVATTALMALLSTFTLAQAAQSPATAREVCHGQLGPLLAANMPMTPRSKLPVKAVCRCTQALMAQEPAELSADEGRQRLEAHQATCMQPHVKAYTAQHVKRQFSEHLQRERGWSAQQVTVLADCMGNRHAEHLQAHPTGNPDERKGMADWQACTEQAGKAGEPLPLLKAR
jgi:hypothetical protein